MILREIMPFYCEYGKPRASGDDPNPVVGEKSSEIVNPARAGMIQGDCGGYSSG